MTKVQDVLRIYTEHFQPVAYNIPRTDLVVQIISEYFKAYFASQSILNSTSRMQRLSRSLNAD